MAIKPRATAMMLSMPPLTRGDSARRPAEQSRADREHGRK
jgi:hypothetical protein